MKERQQTSVNNDVLPKEERPLPRSWPKNTPPPTRQEAELAAVRIGQMIVQFTDEDRDKEERPTGSRKNTTVTI